MRVDEVSRKKTNGVHRGIRSSRIELRGGGKQQSNKGGREGIRRKGEE